MYNVAVGLQVSDVLTTVRGLVKQRQQELRELRQSGQEIIPITARDLVTLEMAGLVVDLETGAVTEDNPDERYNLAGRSNGIVPPDAVRRVPGLGLPVAGVIVDDAEMGNRVVFYDNGAGEEG